jgi:hypothetical protein
VEPPSVRHRVTAQLVAGTKRENEVGFHRSIATAPSDCFPCSQKVSRTFDSSPIGGKQEL